MILAFTAGMSLRSLSGIGSVIGTLFTQIDVTDKANTIQTTFLEYRRAAREVIYTTLPDTEAAVTEPAVRLGHAGRASGWFEGGQRRGAARPSQGHAGQLRDL